MSRHVRCLVALAIVPSLALAQTPPPPGVSGVKVDVGKALPMPQGIRDLLVFRGPPAAVSSVQLTTVPVVTKTLPPADKLSLVRRAVPPGGAPPSGSAMAPYLVLSRATMRTEGRGVLTFWQAQSITHFSTLIGAQSQRGAVELVVYPEAPGRLFLVEWQLRGNVTPGAENACRMFGSGGGEQTFRLGGNETSIIPMVFESASAGAHGFRVECAAPWAFSAVEVTVLR